EKALSSIVDGHLTTMLTGFVLLEFTSGAVHNFAVTLIMGLATSIFTSVVVSHLIFNYWLGTRKPTTLSILGTTDVHPDQTRYHHRLHGRPQEGVHLLGGRDPRLARAPAREGPQPRHRVRGRQLRHHRLREQLDRGRAHEDRRLGDGPPEEPA